MDSDGGGAVDPVESFVGQSGQGLYGLQCAVGWVETVDGDVGGLLGVGVDDVEGGVVGEVAGAVSGRSVELGWGAWVSLPVVSSNRKR